MRLLNRLGQGALILALLVITGCSQPTAAPSVLLGGDVMLYRGGEALFPSGYSAFSPWGDLLEAVRIEPADLFAVNLESPFGLGEVAAAPEMTDMSLCAEDSALGLLQQAGVGLVTNANNHTADCGTAGLEHTKKVLDAAGILLQGEAASTRFIPVGEQVLAVLSLNDYAGDYNVGEIKEELHLARETSDLVLFSVHWGQEYQAGPSPRQQELAQELVDAGADVIWGHHPHVLQRMEWLHSTVDGHAGLVMYSLGNALSDQWMLPDAQRTAVVRIAFKDHKLEEILIIPLTMDKTQNQLKLMEDPKQLDWITQRIGVNDLNKQSVNIRVFDMGDYR